MITDKPITDYKNANGRRVTAIAAIYTYANGNHIVFDDAGTQVPELQDPAMLDEARRLAGPHTRVQENCDWHRQRREGVIG